MDSFLLETVYFGIVISLLSYWGVESIDIKEK